MVIMMISWRATPAYRGTMGNLPTDASHSHDTTFSLVQGGHPLSHPAKTRFDPPQWARHPTSRDLFIALTWVPIMTWAIVSRRLFPGMAPESLLQHFSIHVRCLVAIPLFIAAEVVAEAINRRIYPYFVTSGIVTKALESRFVAISRQTARLHDSWLAWAVLVALALMPAWRFTGVGEVLHEGEQSWAVSSETGHLRLGFGGWWLVFVVRPVFAFFLLHWGCGYSLPWSSPGASYIWIYVWSLPIPTVLAVLDLRADAICLQSGRPGHVHGGRVALGPSDPLSPGRHRAPSSSRLECS